MGNIVSHFCIIVLDETCLFLLFVISLTTYEELNKTWSRDHHLGHTDTKPESQAATLGQVRSGQYFYFVTSDFLVLTSSMKRKESDVSFLVMSVSETQTTPLGIKSIELYCAVVLDTAVSFLGEGKLYHYSPESALCTRYPRSVLRV